MWRATQLVLVLALVVSVAGCDRSKNKASTEKTSTENTSTDTAKAPVPEAVKVPTIKDDPAANFEAYSDAYIKKAKEMAAASQANHGVGNNRYTWSTDNDPAINVRKTDSLTSPYIATLTCVVITGMDIPKETQETLKMNVLLGEHHVTLTFAAQKNKWVLKSVKAVDEIGAAVGVHPDSSGQVLDFFQNVAAAVNENQ